MPAWEANTALIGLDEAAVAELAALADEAAQARAAYRQAQAAARAAGETYRDCTIALRRRAAAAAAQIRSHAAAQPTPAAVLAAARLPAHAKKGTAPAPARPANLSTRLLQSGWLECGFECKNDRRLRGVTYLVERRIGLTGNFEFLMNTGTRRFTDRTIPLGSGEVLYRITAQTSTRRGLPAIFVVRFGDAAGGGMVLRDAGERAA